MSNTYSLETSFGDFEIDIPENTENHEQFALNELIECIQASKCRQSYPDDNGFIHSVDIGFYYGSKVVDLSIPVKCENEATNAASEQLIAELNAEF